MIVLVLFCFQVIVSSTETTEALVFLFGNEYNHDTLENTGNNIPCQVNLITI